MPHISITAVVKQRLISSIESQTLKYTVLICMIATALVISVKNVRVRYLPVICHIGMFFICYLIHCLQSVALSYPRRIHVVSHIPKADTHMLVR